MLGQGVREGAQPLCEDEEVLILFKVGAGDAGWVRLQDSTLREFINGRRTKVT